MKREAVIDLYDEDYARTYNDRFLFGTLAKSDTDFEVALLEKLLTDGGPWLDVACGTGYFLSRFPDIERAGLELSPAMLEHAGRANPGASFHQRDFIEPNPEWTDEWALTSCMWYAYCLVDSIEEIKRLIGNLADWTAPQGKCFFPVCDPALLCQLPLPFKVDSPWEGEVYVTGITWAYVEGSKRHDMFAPHVDHLVEMFSDRFAGIEVVEYPPALPGWEGKRRAIVASAKRR